MRATLTSASVLLSLCTILAACTSLPVERRVTVSQNILPEGPTGVLSENEAKQKVEEFGPYAQMAAAVYRYEYQDRQQDRTGHACDYERGLGSAPTDDLPSGWVRLDQHRLEALGLAREREPLQLCNTKDGVQYEIYVKLDGDHGLTAAVVSFSGTEYDRDNLKGDWAANLSGLTFGATISKEYKTAVNLLVPVVDRLSEKLPIDYSVKECDKGKFPHTLDFVGHSLGGGLAQHLLYASTRCSARRAVTFNTSPVNGWFYLKLRGAIHNPDPEIYRFFVDGEVLSFLRRITTPFNFARENRFDYRIESPTFAEGEKNLIARHSIKCFADELTAWGAGKPPLTDCKSPAPALGNVGQH